MSLFSIGPPLGRHPRRVALDCKRGRARAPARPPGCCSSPAFHKRAATASSGAAAAAAAPQHRRRRSTADLRRATARGGGCDMADVREQPAAAASLQLFTLGADSLDQLLPAGAWARGLQALYEHKSVAHDLAEAAAQLTADAARAAKGEHGPPGVAVVVARQGDEASQLAIIRQLRSASRALFIVFWHPDATESASLRWRAFEAGANMVARCPHALAAALEQVAHLGRPQGQQTRAGAIACTCDWCGLPGLSPGAYGHHQPLYHINEPNIAGTCQVCGRHTGNIARHLHDEHHPEGEPPEERTGVFALVVVRRPRDGRFLVVQEFAGAGYWLPGGGVNPGEGLAEAAARECWEEAGVAVTLRGILDLEAHHSGAWRRIIFWAEPDEACEVAPFPAAAGASGSGSSGAGARLEACCCPKQLPDFESAGACWVDAAELDRLPLRSAAEPCRWFPLLARPGGPDGLRGELPHLRSLQLPPDWAEVFAGFPVLAAAAE